MERKPRQGRSVPRDTSERAREIQWPSGNETWVAMASGYGVIGGKRRHGWRVGLHVSDDMVPRARVPMEPTQALQLARALVAVAGSVEHLNEFHPDGDRTNCHHPSVTRLSDGSLEPEEVDRLLDEAFGPLGEALQRAVNLTQEVRAMLNALYTIALEHGLFAPAGSIVSMPPEQHAEVTERVDQKMACLSDEAKGLLIMTLYLSGDKSLAEIFGLPEYTPSEGMSIH
jgi:hypothetical protein